MRRPASPRYSSTAASSPWFHVVLSTRSEIGPASSCVPPLDERQFAPRDISLVELAIDQRECCVDVCG